VIRPIIYYALRAALVAVHGQSCDGVNFVVYLQAVLLCCVVCVTLSAIYEKIFDGDYGTTSSLPFFDLGPYATSATIT